MLQRYQRDCSNWDGLTFCENSWGKCIFLISNNERIFYRFFGINSGQRAYKRLYHKILYGLSLGFCLPVALFNLFITFRQIFSFEQKVKISRSFASIFSKTTCYASNFSTFCLPVVYWQPPGSNHTFCSQKLPKTIRTRHQKLGWQTRPKLLAKPRYLHH